MSDHHDRPPMGVLPAAPGCDCRVCRPEPTTDEQEQSCVETVLRYGWQVMLVRPGSREDEPGFAYTVGLMHRAGHPEILMSGLDLKLMHAVLNDVAERVLDGAALQPGHLIEGALSGVPVLVEALSETGLKETVTWSRWFHRGDVPALQLVWPDTGGRFAWQPGAHESLDVVQPPSWRVELPRVGPVAADPEWPLPIPPEQLVFVCSRVSDDGEPVLRVVRESDPERGEDWQFLCGGDHGDQDDDEARLLHAAHLVRGAPSVRAVADLGLDEAAWRERAGAPWRRGPVDAHD